MRKEKAMAVMRCAGIAVAGILAGCGWCMTAGVENVLAAESVGEEMVVNNVAADVGADADADGELSENSWGGVSKSGNTAGDENLGVYDFKDNKTTGTVTVTKVWDDDKTNEERAIPDIKISTAKPSKSTLGYTVTFHGNGLKFADETDENMIVYNSAGEIVQGEYKMAVGNCVGWCTGKDKGDRVVFLDDGTPQIEMTGDLDLWAKRMTFEIKGYKYSVKNNNEFNALIPDAVTEILFTDEIKPTGAEIIDVDADGDGGVVAWTENEGVVMKVSTQIKGMKVQAAKDSGSMFYGRDKFTNIDFTMLDTQNVTNMGGMFSGCSNLTSLNLTPLDTSKVTDMHEIFKRCSCITSLDLTPLDTSSVTDINGMFYNCSGLTTLDLTPLDTSNVTNMGGMFSVCSNLTSLNLTPLDTSKVTNMDCMFTYCMNIKELDCSKMDVKNVTSAEDMFSCCIALSNLKLPVFSEKLVKISGFNGVYLYDYGYNQQINGMFENCRSLTSLDLTPLNTTNVKGMDYMFAGCSGLTVLDLTPLDTSNVTDMDKMFLGCRGLTNLDLSPLNTANVGRMHGMFQNCSGLTSLDLTPMDTSNVRNMWAMFAGCSGLTSLDLTPMNTSNVRDMSQMFSDCSSLASLDLTPMNTANVTIMYEMFRNCSGLTSLDLTQLNTSNVSKMTAMFEGCRGLTSLDLTSLDTSKVTDMRIIFLSCKNLTTITTGPNFKFVGTNYNLSGTWQNTAGETFTSGNFPSNVADTYTKIK